MYLFQETKPSVFANCPGSIPKVCGVNWICAKFKYAVATAVLSAAIVLLNVIVGVFLYPEPLSVIVIPVTTFLPVDGSVDVWTDTVAVVPDGGADTVAVIVAPDGYKPPSLITISWTFLVVPITEGGIYALNVPDDESWL